jgi:hypothetical protein
MLVLLEVLNLGCEGAPTDLADTQGILTAATPAVAFQSTRARAAVVIRDVGCGLLGGDGEFVFADRAFIIATQSTRHNTTLICKVKNVANPTGRAVRYNSEHNPSGVGAECGIFRPPDEFVSTTDWTETISASGNATLRCHYKQ